MRLGLNCMRPGLNFGFWGTGAAPNVAVVQFAESLGYDSVWVAEAYGSDAVVPLTWLAACTSKIKLGTAVLQMSARSPAMTAMTAATLDVMSGGRVILGLGVSGPQVVEGWHNEAFPASPLQKTREYVTVVREILRRNGAVEFHGDYYDLPYRGPGATGQGKPMRLMLRPRRPSIPIYLAAMGPNNVRLAAQICDGWLPLFFNPARADVFEWVLGDIGTRHLDIAATVTVSLGRDVDACRRRLKPVVALWLGGMGSRKYNFYNDLACRFGYEGPAKKIQELYLAGRPMEAAAIVPDELIDEVALCGPPERIAEMIEPWRHSPVTTMIVAAANPRAIELMAELML